MSTNYFKPLNKHNLANFLMPFALLNSGSEVLAGYGDNICKGKVPTASANSLNLEQATDSILAN